MSALDQDRLYAVVQRPLDSLDLTSEEEATKAASEYADQEPGTEWLVVQVVAVAFTPSPGLSNPSQEKAA